MTPRLPTAAELDLVMPEIWLIIAMCAVVMVPLINRHSVILPLVTAVIGLGLAAVFALNPLARFTEGGGSFVFGDMLAVDPFSQFFKLLLAVFTLFILAQWVITSLRTTDARDVPDYLCLLLGAAVGMALMASASHLVMIFVAMETASLPSFALAGFRKRHRASTEGSLKYVLFGSAASAVGVYGMSLVYGATGTMSLAGIAEVAARPEGFTPMLGVGLMVMFAGIAFKLSAAPLHFWCPDVFEGAPIEITTFLSVASKGAAVCLLIRVLQTFSAYGGINASFVGFSTGVAILGCVTATWGNLAALRQTSIRRLLAYSSIAHAGYMIIGASLITVTDVGAPGRALAGALLFYIVVYMFMNLGAFTVAGVVAQRAGTEDIRDYAQMVNRSPALMVLLAVFLLSLFGMPGLGGFMAKAMLGMAMFEVNHPAAFALVAVLLFNTLLSLYYYLRPIYFMVFVVDDQDRPRFAPQGAALALLLICAAAVVWTGIFPNWTTQTARRYATLVLRPTMTQQAMIAPSSDAPLDESDLTP
ncbi:MAG: hypothetical protein CMJ18_00730 [Phycisphaeraceae bacterium]|nr:hypothetical protein [Phycisphaeraceae bacterium]